MQEVVVGGERHIVQHAEPDLAVDVVCGRRCSVQHVETNRAVVVVGGG